MCVQPVPWPEPDPLIAAAIEAKYRGKRPRPLAVLIWRPTGFVVSYLSPQGF
jgi:hypothetical protein